MKSIPVVFISYDEPNAEENFAHLKTLVPSALRSHGVKGFDAAHKTAAKTVQRVFPSATHFFTVDGDNQLIVKAWFNLMTALDSLSDEDFHRRYDNKVLCWRAINNVNGLCYGNGGVKLWSIPWVENMKTHELSEGEVKTDFCWDQGYMSLDAIISNTIINGSAYQAWRSGFREGTKAVMVRGQVQNRLTVAEHANSFSVKRFLAWASLGADVPFGPWANLGALEGFFYVNNPAFDPKKFIDYSGFYLQTWQRLTKEIPAAWLADKTTELAALIAPRVKAAKEFARDWNLHVPSFGPLQSSTCKLLMEYYQPINPLEESPWAQH